MLSLILLNIYAALFFFGAKYSSSWIFLITKSLPGIFDYAGWTRWEWLNWMLREKALGNLQTF